MCWGANTEDEFDPLFATLVQLPAEALVVASDAFFNSQRETLLRLAARHGVANTPHVSCARQVSSSSAERAMR